MSRSQDFCITMPKDCSSISKSRMRKWLIEGIVFVLSLGGLIASLTGKVSKNHVIWFLELWKWGVLVMVIFGGRIIMKLMMVLVVESVKKVFLFMEVKVYYSYYIYSLGKCIGVALWFGSVLLTWVLLFKSSEVKRFLNLANYVKGSHLDSHIQKYITRTLGTLVIGGFLWVLKTLLVNMLSSPFQATRWFDRFRESLIDQYILEIFSEGSNENSDVDNWINHNHLPCKNEENHPVISRLKGIEPEEISAWTMNELMKVIKSSQPLSQITRDLEKLAKKEKDMAELFVEADPVADKILKKLSGKSDNTRAEQRKLFEAEESDMVKQHINGTVSQEGEEIGKQALKKWLVNAVIERRSLAQSLHDTAIAIEELNRLVSMILLILLFVLWLIMLGILTTQAFVAIMGQFVALAFIFGDTVKSVFQGIIFVFVQHPFDIGDSCLIEGEEMVVRKMKLLSTVFWNNVKDKIVYPNSVLTTMHVKNLNKGDRHVIEDSFEISIDSSTPKDQINELKNEIEEYLEKHKDKWLHDQSVFHWKEIEDRKLKIVLRVYYRKTDLLSDLEIMSLRRDWLIGKLKNLLENEKKNDGQKKEEEKGKNKDDGLTIEERDKNKDKGQKKGKKKIIYYNILPKAVDAE